MAEEAYTLELLLNKATSPALYDDDFDAIAAFCDQVNRELEGPQFAVQLLAHKIQSPTEREALCALSTLEACVKHCGASFHKEIGKFRFLNEIIKALSPKFLGSRTTERVKKRITELLYSWCKGLPHEAKIAEAYKMLKDQKIILEDPTHMDKVFELFPPPKPRKADFEDEEKSKELARLLNSKRPKDLKAANNLIKELVKEDSEKSEKRSRRIQALETINTQGKLLSEMLKHYKPSTDREQLDTMTELYESLEKQRPTLFKLAGETGEHETDAMGEILKVNDEVTKALLLYMNTVESRGQEQNGAGEGSVRGDATLLELSMTSQGQQNLASPEPALGTTASTSTSASAGLQADFQSLGFGYSAPTTSSYPDIDGLLTSSQQQTGQMSLIQATMGAPGVGVLLPSQNGTAPTTTTTTTLTASLAFQQSNSAAAQLSTHPQYYAAAQMITASLMEPSVFSESRSVSAAKAVNSPAVAPSSATMADLDAIGQSLLEKNRSKDFVRPPAGPPPKLTMAQMVAAKTPAAQPLHPPQSSQASAQHPLPLPLSVLDTPLTPPAPQHTSTSPSVLMADMNGVHPRASDHSSSDDLAAFLGGSAPPVSDSPSAELLPLTDVFVPLDSIKPAEDVAPLTLYDQNSLKSMIHISHSRPRPDVLVMVLSTLSTNVKAISSFLFQAAVPKVMKVKLQPPSATALPAYSPLLPPSAITQVMLIANPRKEKLRLKFKISYVLGENAISDVGDVEDFPVQ